MDLPSTKCYQSRNYFHTQSESAQPNFNGGQDNNYGKTKSNPFADAFPDPLCKLNLKETSEFVKSFPMPVPSTANIDNIANFERRRDSSARKSEVYSPGTQGRPVFSFSVPRKSIPSKWDDAEKWLFGTSSSCHESPAHHAFQNSKGTGVGGLIKQQQTQAEVFIDKTRVTDHHDRGLDDFSSSGSSASIGAGGGSATSDIHKNHNSADTHALALVEDKVIKEVDKVNPKFIFSEPRHEGFFFMRNQPIFEPMKDAATVTGSTEVFREIKHRDVGTEMTPFGSSTTSRCHTPFKSNSPARHNTPMNRSGPLALTATPTTCSNHQFDFTQALKECHLAKLKNGDTQLFDSVSTTNWSSREDEEEDISKSLRHYEIRSVSDNHRVSNAASAAGGGGGCASWEEDEKTKSCIRYQREEARIQAWVNLQSAKAESQSRKLEVKIEKMRSDLEERLMKRMAMVHKRAEEWRETAQREHTEQIKKANERANKKRTANMISRGNTQISCCYASCGCLPCNNLPL